MPAIESTIDSPIQSPCSHVCVVHPSLHFCMGCGRSLDEIANWIELTAAERGRIMAQLPARVAAMNSGNVTSSPV